MRRSTFPIFLLVPVVFSCYVLSIFLVTRRDPHSHLFFFDHHHHKIAPRERLPFPDANSDGTHNAASFSPSLRPGSDEEYPPALPLFTESSLQLVENASTIDISYFPQYSNDPLHTYELQPFIDLKRWPRIKLPFSEPPYTPFLATFQNAVFPSHDGPYTHEFFFHSIHRPGATLTPPGTLVPLTRANNPVWFQNPVVVMRSLTPANTGTLWTIETAPRLILVRDLLKSHPEISLAMFSDCPLVNEYLTLLGLSTQTVFLNEGQSVESRTVLLPAYIPGGMVAPRLITEMRDTLFWGMAGRGILEPAERDPDKRVVVLVKVWLACGPFVVVCLFVGDLDPRSSRSGSSWLCVCEGADGLFIANHLEFLHSLQSNMDDRYGVVEFDPAAHSVASTINLFRRARLVIGPPTGALTNLIYTPPLTPILAFIPTPTPPTPLPPPSHPCFVMPLEADHRINLEASLIRAWEVLFTTRPGTW
ncbi:hypothetical protein PAPYR_10600 [Paratrimastix pyriformis]|uniref:Uncharacterized protein n=1 Tax=Paratrimastix pyriformis TaxID=342808 RepID=A0ABQ8UB84_9EUKA|nr:hypothetical protein PAPYR_10600 [Paratrimastix pyriformis]